MQATITLLPGDGIGPEVVAAAVAVLRAVAARHGHAFEMPEALIGGAAIDAVGDPLPAASLEACRTAQAVLLGAVGGPKWSDPAARVRPEQGLLKLRKEQFSLRMQRATGQTVKPTDFGRVRKDVARLKTVMREQQIAAAEAPATTKGK